jgi:predicted deacetylase
MNEEILEELKAEQAGEELRRYKSNWLRHVTRVMPKIMLNYRPMDEDDLEDLGRDY